MADWALALSDLKNYPHFDPPLSAEAATSYALDPATVSRHAFFPFMLYEQKWNLFAKKGQLGKPKVRPIRYAARRDAYVYARYRHILAERLENELRVRSIENSVLAYRRVVGPAGTGKCNIHFAKDAFDRIKMLRDCCVVALDISSYFESLDHNYIKHVWSRIIGEPRLPADHYNVFRNITRYSFVDKRAVMERLGHFGPKRTTSTGKTINGYLTPFREMPTQLCTGAEFRKIIAANGSLPSIIETNYKNYGIPQGAPISDVIANMYLLDFDTVLHAAVTSAGGYYTRYSDDILIIAPGGEVEGRHWMDFARSEIAKYGSKLVIKEEKAAMYEYKDEGSRLSFRRIHGTQGRNGLEYLGFRFDGNKYYIRDSTISNLYRKVARSARREANALARRYPDKDKDQILELFDIEKFIGRFGRVEDFSEHEDNYKKWTFWTYARRASEIFGPDGDRILNQLKRFRRNTEARFSTEVERAIVSRSKRLL